MRESKYIQILTFAYKVRLQLGCVTEALNKVKFYTEDR